MRKIDIIKEISQKTGIERVWVAGIIETFIKTVEQNILNKETVYFRGFGTFMAKKKAAKIGRIIHNNTTVRIPEHYAPSFKPSKQFKNRVNKGGK